MKGNKLNEFIVGDQVFLITVPKLRTGSFVDKCLWGGYATESDQMHKLSTAFVDIVSEKRFYLPFDYRDFEVPTFPSIRLSTLR